jgi:hypothetical protein
MKNAGDDEMPVMGSGWDFCLIESYFAAQDKSRHWMQ